MKIRQGASWPGSDRARRPFWLHQIAEYLIGGMLIASGLQSPSPVVPAVLGAAIAVNAAFVKGPLSAFDVVPRRLHAVIDPLLAIVLLLAAVLPWFDIDGGTRAILAGFAAVYAFIWWFSDYGTTVRQPTGREELSRSAGRIAARGVNRWRGRKR